MRGLPPAGTVALKIGGDNDRQRKPLGQFATYEGVKSW
jgi:hypothetical protein